MQVVYVNDNYCSFSAFGTFNFYLCAGFAFAQPSSAFGTHCIFHIVRPPSSHKQNNTRIWRAAVMVGTSYNRAILLFVFVYQTRIGAWMIRI